MNKHPEDKIETALLSILRASGVNVVDIGRRYSPLVLGKMREEMRKIMSDSYIKGSNHCAKVMKVE